MNRIEVALESHRFCLSHNRVLTGEECRRLYNIQSNPDLNIDATNSTLPVENDPANFHDDIILT